jgi:hypothetical protein
MNRTSRQESGNLVGLAFLRIVRLADYELCPNDAAAQQLLHGLISGLLLQREQRMGRGRRGR